MHVSFSFFFFHVKHKLISSHNNCFDGNALLKKKYEIHKNTFPAFYRKVLLHNKTVFSVENRIFSLYFLKETKRAKIEENNGDTPLPIVNLF